MGSIFSTEYRGFLHFKILRLRTYTNIGFFHKRAKAKKGEVRTASKWDPNREQIAENCAFTIQRDSNDTKIQWWKRYNKIGIGKFRITFLDVAAIGTI